MNIEKIEKNSHNELYHNKVSPFFLSCNNAIEYMNEYRKIGLSPFYISGNTKGYVRGLAVKKLLESAKIKNKPFKKINILDAGCGMGELSVFLACYGFKVIGVDISIEGCKAGEKLAKKLKVDKNCTFLTQSLEFLSIKDNSIDFIIGHASLHHFIKYKKIPKEFHRILKKDGMGFFADSYGENLAYHLFHDKEKMKKLGDVVLTKNKIENYFKYYFTIELIPTDWFVMIDKLFLRLLPSNLEKYIRKFSKINFWIDRHIPSKNRIFLFLSGSVLTIIRKKNIGNI